MIFTFEAGKKYHSLNRNKNNKYVFQNLIGQTNINCESLVSEELLDISKKYRRSLLKFQVTFKINHLDRYSIVEFINFLFMYFNITLNVIKLILEV